MHSLFPCPPAAVRGLRAVLLFPLIVLGAPPLPAQPGSAATQLQTSRPLSAADGKILARVGEILNQSVSDEAERQVRLEVIKATLTGTTIRPADDYPEMRNPRHWALVNDSFVVSPASTPVEAIADLWVVHESDGVPVPRIRCLKYTSLVLIQGLIQHFRQTNNPAGLDALNRLIGDREIPRGLPDGGENLLWKRRPGGDHLLPGDQVWVDNPFFDKGRELIRQELYQQMLGDGKSPAAAAAAADSTTESMTAGEEGSNVFFIGDDRFIRGASSLSRLCRDSFQSQVKDRETTHEQVFTQMIYNLTRFQQHMIDDNFSAQACLRADPASVRPTDFKIERVRSPLGPANLLRQFSNPEAAKPVESLIDAMASHNPPPRLVAVGDATVPLFEPAFDWQEQQRVRTAIDRVMRIKSDDSWWQLREKLHDDRYVLTATRGGVTKNFTVGELCSDLVDARLCLGFTSHLPLVPGRLPPSFQPEQAFWQNEGHWSNERKPLYAMQVALCERALQQWESITATLPGSDGQAHTYTADEKARYVAGVKKEIAARNQAKQAASEVVILPWTPAPSGWEGYDAERASEMRGRVEHPH